MFVIGFVSAASEKYAMVAAALICVFKVERSKDSCPFPSLSQSSKGPTGFKFN